MSAEKASKPNWDQLYETASTQAGHFLPSQAKDAGISPALLSKTVRTGRIQHPQRGIYRYTQFPAGDQDELVVAWLWSNQAGVFSHETALALRDLSDALPNRLHLTVPKAWENRRLRVPRGLALHFGDLAESDREWIGAVPVTTVVRTIADCASEHVPQEFITAAINQAVSRGLATLDQLGDAARMIALQKV